MIENIKIDGGLGRVIALTGVITEYAKKAKNEVNVITPYPELFFGNPYINRSYHIGHQYIFEDVIKNAKYIDLEPYNDYDYYHNDKHIIEVYAKQLLGKSEFIEPQIFLSEDELAKAKEFIADKKIILYQPFGSAGGKFKQDKKDDLTEVTFINDPSNRSLEPLYAKDLLNEIKDSGFEIMQIRNPDQYNLEGIGSILQPDGQALPIRQILALLPYIQGFIGCDSFLQHGAKMMGVENGIVFWGTTKLENLGYADFNNLTHDLSYVWTPNRQPSNNPDVEKKNKGLMDKAHPKEPTFKKIKEIISKW